MKQILSLIFVLLVMGLSNRCNARGYFIGKGDTLCYSWSDLSTLPVYDSTISLTEDNEIVMKGIKSLGKLSVVSDISQLISKFNAGKPKKGQYEKTESFIGRLNVYRNKFKKKYIINVDIEKNYDADEETIILKLNDYLKIKEAVNYIGSSSGQNAFGVKRKVSTYLYTTYSINVSNYIPNEMHDTDYNIGNDLPPKFTIVKIECMKPSVAKNILPSLGVAFESENIYDTETMIGETETATIDDPREIRRTNNTLYTKVKAFYLYNKITKNILGKIYFKETIDVVK
jgi:hypothetical protein